MGIGFMGLINVMPVLVHCQHTNCILSRIWCAVKKQLSHIADTGVATHEDVDRTWILQTETPLGLFALMDRVGLDVVRDIAKVYFEESGDLSDACPEILLDRIARGDLGGKRGKGFYTYPDPAWKSSSFFKSASPSRPCAFTT